MSIEAAESTFLARRLDPADEAVKAIIAAWAGDNVLYRHRIENSCLRCASDMNSCIDAFTNDLGKCCKGCDHSEFVQVWPSTDPTKEDS